ncbi:hypothetical protein NE865_05792 [Phthorimaea operculella]|nr:hypothetical protein NE865_05792 [Phthorimaea operculella]
MDNPLTPKKIQRLINLAEGGSFNIESLLYTAEEVKVMAAQANLDKQRSPAYRYETSSGIIDLDHVEGFGESGSNMNLSLSRSNTFNPGEMTGRSTGASETPGASGLSLPNHEQYGRHSIAIDSIASQMDKQTSEIQDLMRHSIASNYSFHSKRDLTADEASLIAREAPLPIVNQTQTYFTDNTNASANTSTLSVGAYFGKRCEKIGKILGNTESPDRSYMMPSITEVSGTNLSEQSKASNLIQIDDTLDSVPVRQPRNNDMQSLGQSTASSYKNRLEKTQNDIYQNPASTQHTSRFEKTHSSVFKQPARPKPQASKAPERPQHVRTLNPTPTGIPHKSFGSSKPTDLLMKNLQASLLGNMADVTEDSVENSLSLSKIADYLGKQSNVSITDMLQKQKRTKPPLSELNMNSQIPEDLPVTKLVDAKKSETGSSAGTIQTVISFDKLKIHDKVPEVIITHPTMNTTDILNEQEDKRLTRSKSPSSRSPSTMSTVRDNYSSFKSSKSGDSPNISKDEANRSKVPSPNIAYKELDKSVDWQEVLQQKKIRHRGVVQEQWVSIEPIPVEGFVGVTTSVTIRVTTITDNWLTAKFQFNSLPNEGRDLNIELSRLPLLLVPGKTEDFTFNITSDVEMATILPFSFFIKDASSDSEIEQKGELQVNFRLPTIQAMSADGINKLLFPAVPEKTIMTKIFVLISDCPADLKLKLSITEGDSTFCIKSVQEIKRSDVNKILLERQGSEDAAKTKTKAMNNQLCRLVKDSAIMVAISFISPKLDMKLFSESGVMPTYYGMLQVSLIGSNTVLRSVSLVGHVGIPKLHVDETANNVQVTNEAAKITVSNRGPVAGTWAVKYRSTNEAKLPFQITPTRFTLAAEESVTIQVCYVGSTDDGVVEVPIYIEELSTGESTEVVLTGGSDKPKTFPIKCNASTLSWVRAGRKEISLKNNSDKKVHIRCYIVGDGYSLDLPGGESRGIYLLTFSPFECRPLSIIFAPTSCMPHAATLHMALERSNSETSRKVKLFGCGSGEPVRWSGLVTYSDTAALVRATSRNNIDLKLHNKSTMPAFVAAKIHYNLQVQVEPFCHLMGATRIVPGRKFHTVSLRVDWPRVERRAREAATTALATVTVLTGAETTRRRILNGFGDNWQHRFAHTNTHSLIPNVYRLRSVVGKKTDAHLFLRVDWPRVERRAREAATTALATVTVLTGAETTRRRILKAREAATTALATVTVLTGAETTRRRILKILRDESGGSLDASLLPDHLRVLAQEFDGEDSSVDNFFIDFTETRSSLSELIHCGLQELTAHIDLPQDFADENTIIIADDTVMDHHTMME